MVSILKKQITKAGLAEKDFSGHRFGKGAAQHAADHGMLYEIIQRLCRWSSNAFKLYFTTTPEALFNLNLSFQKGIPLAVSRAIVQTLGIKKPVPSVRTTTPAKDTFNSPYPLLPTAQYLPISHHLILHLGTGQPGQAKPSLGQA